MTLQERIKAPTPLFFKKVRKTGLVLAAVGSSVLLAPVALPAVVKLVAGYLVTAGSAAVAVSQTAVGGKRKQPKADGKPAARNKRK